MSTLQDRIASMTLPNTAKVFGAAAPAGLSALDRLGSTMRLQRGDVICHEGDHNVACYRVISGCVRLSRVLPDGRRHVVAFAFPGDFVGASEHDLHDTTAEALGPATIARYPRQQLESIAERDLAACNLLRRAAIAGFAAAQAHGLVLARLSAAERLASFLLDLAGRVGAGRIVALPMTRSDIGDYLGLTIETVSRTISQFKRCGHIRLLDPAHVELVDTRALANLANGDSELAG